MEKIIVVLLTFVLFMCVWCCLGALMAFPTMGLWNYVISGHLFPSVASLDFWHAWGLNVLCAGLFQSASTSSSK